ncbi:MAG: TonB family protein [Lysobacter sp.]|nr:TonB family protein [Lysobacter sp.]
MSALVTGMLSVLVSLAPTASVRAAQDDPAATRPGPLSLVARPSFAPLIEALRQADKTELRAVAVVTYDAAGVVHAVRLDPGTGVQAVDDAILSWCKAMRLTPGTAGEGRVPFDLVIDDSLATSLAELPEIRAEDFVDRPPMKDLTHTFVKTGRRSASLEVAVEYSADGTVTHAEVIRSSGNAVLDKAAIEWARHVRLRPGTAGRGRLPFTFGLK